MRRLSAAEDFFTYLGVEYKPEVVNVARLHILRRMGEYLADDEIASLGDGPMRERVRAHLRAAYADFSARTPIQERVFKVHKDALREAEPKTPKQIFVPLSSIK